MFEVKITDVIDVFVVFRFDFNMSELSPIIRGYFFINVTFRA